MKNTWPMMSPKIESTSGGHVKPLHPVMFCMTLTLNKKFAGRMRFVHPVAITIFGQHNLWPLSVRKEKLSPWVPRHWRKNWQDLSFNDQKFGHKLNAILCIIRASKMKDTLNIWSLQYLKNKLLSTYLIVMRSYFMCSTKYLCGNV